VKNSSGKNEKPLKRSVCFFPLFVGLFVCLSVCYYDNSKLRASIFTKLGL